jgi:magnesium transporter
VFRVIEIDAQGKRRTSEDLNDVGIPPLGVKRWIDLREQDDEQLNVLGHRFPFHPLTLEDCAHFDQRPKLEAYPDYVFLVIHGVRLTTDKNPRVVPIELHLFVARDYIITVHAEPIASLETVWNRVASDPIAIEEGPDFIAYLLADSLIDSYFPLLDEIVIKVEQLEDRVLDEHQTVELAEIFYYKRLLVQLRKFLTPQRDVLALLSKRVDGWIDSAAAIYFRNVYDHILVIQESVEATRDLLGNALDAYHWAASQRTNEIMKRLTLLSAIFLPLSFVTGFFGQNFLDMPFGNEAMFFGMLSTCAVLPAAMIYYFIRSKWF